jgi:hypothetical protein
VNAFREASITESAGMALHLCPDAEQGSILPLFVDSLDADRKYYSRSILSESEDIGMDTQKTGLHAGGLCQQRARAPMT